MYTVLRGERGGPSKVARQLPAVGSYVVRGSGSQASRLSVAGGAGTAACRVTGTAAL
jgi:hypothetical protein